MDNRRQAKRFDCNLSATLEYSSGSVSCVIQDISVGGLLISITLFSAIKIGETVTVLQPELGKLIGSVRWVSMGKFGIKLDHNLTEKKVLAAIENYTLNAA